MILKTNAVVNPVAMVVEPLYALPTAVAMLRPLSHNDFALSADFSEVDVINHIFIRDTIGF